MNITDKNIMQCIGSHIYCPKTWFNFCQLNKVCWKIGLQMKDTKATLFTIREEPEVYICLDNYACSDDPTVKRFLPSGMLHGIQEEWGSDSILRTEYWEYGVLKWKRECCYWHPSEYSPVEGCICGCNIGER